LHAVRGPGTGDARLSKSEHRLGEVDAHNSRAVMSRQLECDAGSAGGDIEDRAATEAIDVRDHLAPPATVLPERQQLFEEVVTARQRPEQVLSETIRIASDELHRRPFT
jgi:hypothetical protein